MENGDQLLEKMRQNLPDYVFGRLSKSEKAEFERELPNYPELEKEVAEVRAVFAKAEKIDFDAVLGQRTRNLSIKIKERVRGRRSKVASSRAYYRFLIPVAGVIVVGFLVFTGGIDFSRFFGESADPVADVSETPTQEIVFVQSADAIVAEAENEDQFEEILAVSLPDLTAEDIAANFESQMFDEDYPTGDLVEDLIAETIAGIPVEESDALYAGAARSYVYMMDEIDNLNEDDVNYILEELSHVDFAR